MLEKLPAAIGRSLRRVRPGLERTVSHRAGIISSPPSILVESAAFFDGEPIPTRYTADGEGVSPPLHWIGVPPAARSMAIIVEDADSPTPSPLVHAIVGRMPALVDELGEGEIAMRDGGPVVGRNSYMRAAWLPPDPPPGHGAHRYVFQVFALDHDPDLGPHPGRTALVKALEGHTICHGMLIGTYSR